MAQKKLQSYATRSRIAAQKLAEETETLKTKQTLGSRVLNILKSVKLFN